MMTLIPPMRREKVGQELPQADLFIPPCMSRCLHGQQRLLIFFLDLSAFCSVGAIIDMFLPRRPVYDDTVTPCNTHCYNTVFTPEDIHLQQITQSQETMAMSFAMTHVL